jgi:hypothetical protein
VTHEWTPATYRIARRERDTDIAGEICGVFGVGPSVDLSFGDWWQVTHLPTGGTAGPPFPTPGQARRFAEELAALRDDWADIPMDHRFNPVFRAEVGRLARRILRAQANATNDEIHAGGSR